MTVSVIDILPRDLVQYREMCSSLNLAHINACSRILNPSLIMYIMTLLLYTTGLEPTAGSRLTNRIEWNRIE
jgi:hypothetical protein